MNLVTCSQSCVYQKDGYCKLDNMLYVSNVKIDGCCYYKSSNSRNIDKIKKRAELTNIPNNIIF